MFEPIYEEEIEEIKGESINDGNIYIKIVFVESDHVFGRKHPWLENTLPIAMQTVLEKTLEFFR